MQRAQREQVVALSPWSRFLALPRYTHLLLLSSGMLELRYAMVLMGIHIGTPTGHLLNLLLTQPLPALVLFAATGQYIRRGRRY